jgi:hypothetical protein
VIPICQIELHWLTAEEGGRLTPVRGGRYTPTARFAGEQDHFSVVLEFATADAANPTEGTLSLLVPEFGDFQRRIRPGAALEIMEGPRVVAHCVVGSLDVGEVTTNASNEGEVNERAKVSTRLG